MAREESLIISEELFRALSPVSGDLDWEYIWPLILATQDKWVQPVLGQRLYEKLMSEIDAGTLGGAYKTLVEDFVARMAVWFTCYLGMPFWGVKIVNSGVMQRIVDDGTTISFTDIDKLAEMCRGQGEFYKQRLLDHLCAEGSGVYPEYTEWQSGDLQREHTNYAGGLNMEYYGNDKERKAKDYLKGWLK